MSPTFLLSLLVALVALSVRASEIDESEPRQRAFLRRGLAPPMRGTVIAEAGEDRRDLGGYYSKSDKSSGDRSHHSGHYYTKKSTKSSGDHGHYSGHHYYTKKSTKSSGDHGHHGHYYTKKSTKSSGDHGHYYYSGHSYSKKSHTYSKSAKSSGYSRE